MENIDTYIPLPIREIDKSFLMAIEDVFTITGRGTVATGRIERGSIIVGDALELVGFTAPKLSTLTGVERFQKPLNSGLAGDKDDSKALVPVPDKKKKERPPSKSK